MAHICEYYEYKNGRLVCTVCGKPSDRPVLANEVVEKAAEPPAEEPAVEQPEPEPEPEKPAPVAANPRPKSVKRGKR